MLILYKLKTIQMGKIAMKIAFIRPSMFAIATKDVMYPLVFAIAKAMTPSDVEILFYDERVEKLPDDIESDYIVMTVDTFTAKRAYQLADSYRKKDKKVIMGGFHPSACPEEALCHADSVMIGEIESTWNNLIEDIRNNKLQKRYESDVLVDLSTIKYDYSAFDRKKYNKIGLIQFSRGCKFACEFCSVHAFFKNSIRTKSIDVVLNEIKQLKEKFIFFIDDNLFSNEEEAKKLFKAMIPLKKKWFCQISLDVAKNKELLKLMRKSGCSIALIGFESLNIDNLKQMRKGANIKYNNYKEMIKNLNEAGIMIYGTFVIGYDSDTKETAEKLADFAIQNKFAAANFNPLMPMPATKLYDRLKNENRLLCENWWIDENYHYGDGLFKPQNMTSEELMESCKNARFKFNSNFNILKRFLNFKSNLKGFTNPFLFIYMNIVCKIEVKRKQGKRLGKN